MNPTTNTATATPDKPKDSRTVLNVRIDHALAPRMRFIQGVKDWPASRILTTALQEYIDREAPLTVGQEDSEDYSDLCETEEQAKAYLAAVAALTK